MIRVRNLQRSLEFYGNFLGLREISRKDLGDATLVFLADRQENYFLELTYNHDDRDYELGTQFGHLALIAENLHEVIQKVEAKGWPYRGSRPETGSKYIFIQDPDGFDIEIIQAK